MFCLILPVAEGPWLFLEVQFSQSLQVFLCLCCMLHNDNFLCFCRILASNIYNLTDLTDGGGCTFSQHFSSPDIMVQIANIFTDNEKG